MTNFIKMPPIGEVEKKKPKKTGFTHIVYPKDFGTIKLEISKHSPCNFENILHVGKDLYYGDVFKCWNLNEDVFYIAFGEAGDEFNQ